MTGRFDTCLLEQRTCHDGRGPLGPPRPGREDTVACCHERVWPEGDDFIENGGKACRVCIEGLCDAARRWGR